MLPGRPTWVSPHRYYEGNLWILIRIGWRRGVRLNTSIQTLAEWVPPHRGTLIEISVSGSDHLQRQAGALSGQRVLCTVLPDLGPQAWGLFYHPAWEENSQSNLLHNITPIPTRLERLTSPTQLLNISSGTSLLGSLTRESGQLHCPILQSCLAGTKPTVLLNCCQPNATSLTQALRQWPDPNRDPENKLHLPKDTTSWSFQNPKLSWLVKDPLCWSEPVMSARGNSYSNA